MGEEDFLINFRLGSTGPDISLLVESDLFPSLVPNLIPRK